MFTINFHICKVELWLLWQRIFRLLVWSIMWLTGYITLFLPVYSDFLLQTMEKLHCFIYVCFKLFLMYKHFTIFFYIFSWDNNGNKKIIIFGLLITHLPCDTWIYIDWAFFFFFYLLYTMWYDLFPALFHLILTKKREG